MTTVTFITHPDVVIDPAVPVTQWPLSDHGRTRMQAMLTQPWVADITAVFCSTEQKAIDGAAILAQHLDIDYTQLAALGEIDRSATGYLPRAEHDATAVRCFDHPDDNIRGWESAHHAQARVVTAVDRIIAVHTRPGDIAIVSHGGVGVFLMCHLRGEPISNRVAKPGVANGGACFHFDTATRKIVADWGRIDP